MAWQGYLTYDGVEIINVTRTEVYATAAGATWFRPVHRNDALRRLLGHPTYSNPAYDLAPWYDPDDLRSVDFWGVYPITVEGIEDSSRGSTVTEYTTEGGTVGRLRHGTKAVVTSAILVGKNDAAVEYGMEWLRRVLLGNQPPLTTENGVGRVLGFLSAAPVLPAYLPEEEPITGETIWIDGGDASGEVEEVISPDVALLDYQRFLRRVGFNAGPTVSRKATMHGGCGGEVWIIQFTGVAGDPHIFGAERAIIQGYMSPSVTDPWVPGTTPGTYSTAPYTFTEVVCGDNLWEPIYDPLCSAMIQPPSPPSVPLGCYTPPATWNRRKITIPADNIPVWSAVAPVITVHADSAVRNLRIRFYGDRYGTADPEANPCDFIGDFVLSYIPAGGTMIFDGSNEDVHVITSMGHKRRADSLVFANDGSPVVWPTLSNGYGYVVTLDLPADQPVPTFDLALTTKVA